ncbi:LacI family DNA-binding transcriptional regulator [Pleomorphochaeta sp. DL1XJH-081]|uniref:LacI family DNA-binding transcriptional regulator n=1 Tax=Pleomorphochaeta sp. DL1XJH-081 TaxID=3409690 RepID=UPI003BB64C2E
MAVIKDVAKLAGVSTSTVSKYLNNPSSLREKNRLSIENAIEKLNYSPNIFARHLRVQNSHTIAVIAQEITNPFHAKLYNSIRKVALQEKYSVILYSINDVDGNLTTLLDSMPINYFSGIIVCYFHDMDKSVDFALSNKALPFVIMSNVPYYGNSSNIRIVFGDFGVGIEKITDYIVGLGKKSIAYVGCMTRFPENEPKFCGFKRAMDKVGLEPHSVVRLHKEYKAETGYESARIIMQQEVKPDAILVDNDIMAMGVLRYLEDNNIRIPEDIIVTGFDDISMASYYCPSLTTAHVPIEEMSTKAFKLLLDMMEGKPSDSEIPRFIPEVVIRETTTSSSQ